MKLTFSPSFFKQRKYRIVSLLLLAQAALMIGFARQERVPVIPALRDLPEQLSGWQMVQEMAMDNEAMVILSPDDYLLRDYQLANANRTANLYIAYFKSQRSERMPHSPKNCLPGNGWVPSEARTVALAVPGRPEPVEVNHYVVRKGDQKSIVLYWYQTWNRVVANEYKARMYLAADSIRYNRTDTALVRVLVPVPEESSPAEYEKTATDFVQALFPVLTPYFPQS